MRWLFSIKFLQFHQCEEYCCGNQMPWNISILSIYSHEKLDKQNIYFIPSVHKQRIKLHKLEKENCYEISATIPYNSIKSCTCLFLGRKAEASEPIKSIHNLKYRPKNHTSNNIHTQKYLVTGSPKHITR